MNAWTATIRQEMAATSRERLPQLILTVFVGLTMASAFIGSTAKGTVTRVYQETIAQGLTTAANPFESISALYYARNNVIYIVLIGALLAIVTGVQSTLRDRRAQTMDLVLSRNITPSRYLGAKLAGIALMLAVLLALTAFLSFAGIAAAAGTVPTIEETLQLIGLYGLAWLFLLPFLTLGMLSGIYAATTTWALLAPIVAWSILIFVLPLVGTAALPVSLLNPVAAPAPTPAGIFAFTNAVTGPLSLGEEFKNAAAFILQDRAAPGIPTLALLMLLVAATAGCAGLLATPRQRMRGALHA